MCSGMCHNALFFFGVDIHWGTPNRTCMVEFKEYVDDEASGFVTTSIMGGLVALTLFLVHFTMYWRPVADSGNPGM